MSHRSWSSVALSRNAFVMPRPFHALFACLLLSACAAFRAPTTGLNETATHSGTVTLLRVDDAWNFDPARRRSYHVGDGIGNLGSRFVPVRYEGNIAGLDGPDRIITDEDYVTITLKSGFIKHFVDPGCERASQRCRGELAIVLSFDDGHQVSEDLLIYSSQGQTLGSPLALDDWPIVGPVKLVGDTLLVRLVVIELDQAENERTRQIVQFLTSIAAMANPAAGPALSISRQLSDSIINSNTDDVILDSRFSLQRVNTGVLATRNSMLYGKYILIQQEDYLADQSVSRVSPRALNPVALSDMRFDRLSERLYKVYPYAYEPDSNAAGRSDWTTFAFTAIPPDEGEAGPTPNHDRATARALRINELGFQDEGLDSYELWESQDEAFFQALAESCRAISLSGVEDPTPGSGWTASDYTETLNDLCPRTYTRDELFRFEYPASLYPDANVLVSAYSLHTHLIFSVDRSLPGRKRFDEQFQDFNDYLANEVKAVQAQDALADLSTAISDVRTEVSRQEMLFQRIDQLGPSVPETPLAFAKVCQLWELGLKPPAGATSVDALLSAPVFNEIFHLTGQSFDAQEDVSGLLTDSGSCMVDSTNHTCSCPQP